MVWYNLFCFIILFLASESLKTKITSSQSRQRNYSSRSHWITNIILCFLHESHQCPRNSSRSRRISLSTFTYQGGYYWYLTLQFLRNNSSQKLVQSLMIIFCQKYFSNQAVSLLRLHCDCLWWQRIKGIRQPRWLNNPNAIYLSIALSEMRQTTYWWDKLKYHITVIFGNYNISLQNLLCPMAERIIKHNLFLYTKLQICEGFGKCQSSFFSISTSLNLKCLLTVFQVW